MHRYIINLFLSIRFATFAMLLKRSVKNKPSKFHSGEMGAPFLRTRISQINSPDATKVVVSLGDQKSRMFVLCSCESRKRIRHTDMYAVVILYSVVNSIRFSEDEIREFKGYENLTDEQARDVADFFAMWSIIVYDNLKAYERG